MIPIYKSDNEIEADSLLSLLKANAITCKMGKFGKARYGSNYAEYTIWVEDDQEKEAKRILSERESNSPFVDLPWDTESDSVDPNPPKCKFNSRKFLYIEIVVVVAIIILSVYFSK